MGRGGRVPLKGDPAPGGSCLGTIDTTVPSPTQPYPNSISTVQTPLSAERGAGAQPLVPPEAATVTVLPPLLLKEDHWQGPSWWGWLPQTLLLQGQGSAGGPGKALESSAFTS